MTAVTDLREKLERIFEPGDRGVIGLVDDLLDLCGEQGLHFEWRDQQCLIRTVGTASRDPVHIPLRKSVFRAMLARLAVLCNERIPDSVSPYGGEGTLLGPTNSSTMFHVSFANRPDEQRLEIRAMT